MRTPILEALDDPELSAKLHPIVVKALTKHREVLTPAVAA
jgi:formate dehydrogenase subunit delta